MRVVLDANQLVSGVLVSQGNPAKILDAWRVGRFELLVSEETLAELARVLQYPKIQRRLRWSRSEHEAFLERLRDVSTLVEVKEQVTAVKADPSDDAYLALAVAGHADVLVTGDQHLLTLGAFRGIPIIRAAQFVRILGE